MERQVRFQVGLTRIELLVVIFIVFLAVLLLLAWPRVVEIDGHGPRCTTNLRQIGQAMRMYAEDYGGYYPPLIQPPGQPLTNESKVMSPWYYPLMKKYGLDERVFYCDHDKRFDPSRKFTSLEEELRYMSDHISYGLDYDVKFADGTPYRVRPNGDFVDPSGRVRRPTGPDRYPDYYRADEIADPRTFIVAADSNSELAKTFNFAISIPMDGSSRRVGTRHKAKDRPGGNVLFADDHVEMWVSVTPSNAKPGDEAKDINQPINRRYWTLAGD